MNYNFALHTQDVLLAEIFWKQIAWIEPESYVADNNFLSFVSANKALFAAVRDAVEAPR